MQRIAMDGIEFNVTDNSVVECISEMKDDRSRVKMMQVSDFQKVHIQYARFQMGREVPTIIIAGRDDDQFVSILWNVLNFGPKVLYPGEKITRSMFEERVSKYVERTDSGSGDVEEVSKNENR